VHYLKLSSGRGRRYWDKIEKGNTVAIERILGRREGGLPRRGERVGGKKESQAKRKKKKDGNSSQNGILQQKFNDAQRGKRTPYWPPKAGRGKEARRKVKN